MAVPLFVSIAISVMPCLAAPAAIAAPGPGGLIAVSPAMRLASMGADADLAFYGMNATQTLTFPVVAGLAPGALNAVVEMPPYVRAGTITVTQNNRLVSRIELPGTDRAPISIPLSGAAVDGNALTVQLRSQLVPPPDYCLFDTNDPLRLSEASIAFTGQESPPRVVADFLPPVLQRLTIFIPQAPSRAESDAAVRLTTAVVAHYGKQQLGVDVVALAGDQLTPPQPSQPLERQIVVREGPNPGLMLQGDGVPSLLITGGGNDLVNQSRLLGRNLSRLALASKAVAGPLNSSPQLPGDETTIRALGQPGVNATALKPQVFLPLDQTRLGRPVRDVRIHLQGSYTPLPSSVAGQVVASIAGQGIDRWATDSTGKIDRWVTVPNSMLQRYTNLGITVDLAGDTGRCGEFQPVTLTIDGATAVESTAANPPVPAGFQSLPQAVMPKLEVGIGADAFRDTVRAVSIVQGLQRLGSLPIDTEVVPFQDALDARIPAVLIAADGWQNDKLELPVMAADNGRLDVTGVGSNDRETLTLAPGLRFGSLQTVRDGDRTVLVATSNGAPQQLDSLLEWLDADARRWSSLDGIAVIAPPDRDPVAVAAPEQPAEAAASRTGGSGKRFIVAGIVGLVAGGAGVFLLRRRHRTTGD